MRLHAQVHVYIAKLVLVFEVSMLACSAAPLAIPGPTPAPHPYLLARKNGRGGGNSQKSTAESTELITTSIWQIANLRNAFKSAKSLALPALNKITLVQDLIDDGLIASAEKAVGRSSTTLLWDLKLDSKEKKLKEKLVAGENENAIKCKLKEGKWECVLVQQFTDTTLTLSTNDVSMIASQVVITEDADKTTGPSKTHSKWNSFVSDFEYSTN